MDLDEVSLYEGLALQHARLAQRFRTMKNEHNALRVRITALTGETFLNDVDDDRDEDLCGTGGGGGSQRAEAEEDHFEKRRKGLAVQQKARSAMPVRPALMR